jgi:ParB-like chromosome segregation protein Spo0J
MAKALKVTCSGSATADIDDLREFQGGLKKMGAKAKAKLRRSIEQHGFSAPIFVWKHGKVLDILDGHQRLTVLREMRNEGVTIPKVPIVEIKAANITEAKAKLLKIASQYGDVQKDGFLDFVEDMDVEEIQLSVRLAKGELDLTIDEGGIAEDKPEVEFAEELGERHNYVVLYFDNDVDWLQAQTLLGLKPARSHAKKKGFHSTGVGRVVRGADAIERIRGGE